MNAAPHPQSAPQHDVSPARRFAPVTLRSVLIGAAGGVAVVILQVVSKAAPNTVILPLGSATTLFPGVVLCLFAMAVANLLLKRWRPSAVFQPGEFAVVFGMVTVAASIGAQDQLQYLLPTMVYPFRQAQNAASGEFRKFIPEWYAPRDPSVVEPYYQGNQSLWDPQFLIPWIIPVTVWVVWTMALGITIWAWNVILRRRWMDHDRLAFPCVQLPLEMCRAGGFNGMLSGRLFWGGFLFAVVFNSLTNLNGFIPAIPAIPTWYTATPVLEAAPAPWNALAPMSLTWDPFHIGICYFIPLDILFSAWFFYLLRKAMEVFGFAMGWRELGWDANGFPYTRAQASGAWIVLFFLLVWAERKHLARVFRAGFGLRADLDDSEEPGSYRWAARWLVIGTLFLIGFSVVSGMSIWLTLAYYAFFFMLYVTMTRIYAQVGPPILELYFIDPQRFITSTFGTHWDTPRSWTIFSLNYWINRDHRGQPMAHQLSAFRVGKSCHVPPRTMGGLVLVAFLIGTVTCLLAGLHWAYRLGEDQWVTGGWREAAAGLTVSRYRQWTLNPTGPHWLEVGFLSVGAVITWTLAKLQYTVIGFPFHPIGFALAMCFAVEYNWPAFLIAWLFKLLLFRYGGRGMYLRFAPFFLGLILGAVITPLAWGFLSWLFEWNR